MDLSVKFNSYPPPPLKYSLSLNIGFEVIIIVNYTL